jgi:hypothetical protein
MTDIILSDELFATGQTFTTYGKNRKVLSLKLTRNSIRRLDGQNNEQGYITIVEALKAADTKGRSMVIRKCECGHEYLARKESLKAGLELICKDSSRHSLLSDHELYVIYASMKARCGDTANGYHAYHRYGGRGIRVCDRWRMDGNANGQGFRNFLEDMGERPSAGHELDRIDGDGNYEPGNCQWLLKKLNNHKMDSVTKFKIDGEIKVLSVIAEEIGIAPSTLKARLRVYSYPFHKATNNFYKGKLVFQVSGKSNIPMD